MGVCLAWEILGETLPLWPCDLLFKSCIPEVSSLQEFQINLILKNFQTAGTALASNRGPAGNHTTAIADIELNLTIRMPLIFNVVQC